MSEAGRAERQLYYGSAERESEVRPLVAGPLSVELVAGNLRDIRFDGRRCVCPENEHGGRHSATGRLHSRNSGHLILHNEFVSTVWPVRAAK